MREEKGGEWIELIPVDTLFFRGGEAMVAGETHEAGIPVFPPRPDTIVGAIRTAILSQKRLSPSEAEKLNFWGGLKKPGFWIGGPLFKVKNGSGNTLLFPSPANLFYKKENDNKEDLQILVKQAKPLKFLDAEKFPLKTSLKEKIFWMREPSEEFKPIEKAFWLNKKALEKVSENFDEEGEICKLKVVKNLEEVSEKEPLAVPSFLLYTVEERIGIKRDNRKRVTEQGHLYGVRHIRLFSGVSLVIRIDKPLAGEGLLKKEGYFQLGGEGRIVKYKIWKIEEKDMLPDVKTLDCFKFLSISTISKERLKEIPLKDIYFASLKPKKFGGWDLYKGFHKPAIDYLPQGAVFFCSNEVGEAVIQKFNNLCELIPF